VLLHALRDDLEDDPARFAEAVEQLVEATAAIQAEAMEAHVASRSRELESQANTDPLTGLGNLRALQRQLAILLDVRKRYQHPFAVLLMDIDGLKRINDSHGHPAGDRILMQVAMSLRRSIRSVDTAARVGGDEFCVLLPEQDLKSAAKLAARLATAIEEEVASPGEPAVTVSIGVAASPEHGDDAEALIDTADRAMYRAKAAGEGIALGDPPGTQGVTAEEATT
jgi:diguanylate cyclase (GGDEF)-like protein